MTDYIKREDAIKAVISDAKLKNLLTGNCENEKAIEGMVYGVLCPRDIPSADVRDDATAHKVVGGGERDGSTCWFECDNCGLAVDIEDVFCKHCGARFMP